MNNTIALRLLPNNNLSKCVAIIRKYEELPISAISSCIKDQKNVLEYSTTDYDGLDTIIRCYGDLMTAGIPAEVFEFGLKVSIDVLENRQQRIQDSFDWFGEED